MYRLTVKLLNRLSKDSVTEHKMVSEFGETLMMAGTSLSNRLDFVNAELVEVGSDGKFMRVAGHIAERNGRWVSGHLPATWPLENDRTMCAFMGSGA